MPADVPTLQRSPMPRSGLVQRALRNIRWRTRYSGLMLAARITFAHFSVSSVMSVLKSADEPPRIIPPRSTSCVFTLGSARPALISLLSLSDESERGHAVVIAGDSFGFGWKARRDEPGREATLQHGNQIRLANHNCNFYRLKARVLLPSTPVMTHSVCVVANPGPPAKQA